MHGPRESETSWVRATVVRTWYIDLTVAVTTAGFESPGSTETMQVQQEPGKIFLPTTESIMESILTNLSLTVPVTVNALQKATGLGATALTMALVGLGGKVVAVPEGLLLAPESTPPTKVSGPRGPTAKVQPRLEACKAKFLEMAGSGVTAKDLLEAGGGTFLYTDILLVARNLTEAGVIQDSRKGRKATWNLTTAE